MIIIPARLASTRFPEKVLADIGGLPMVIRTAKRVELIDRVVVACDDEKILDICLPSFCYLEILSFLCPKKCSRIRGFN